MSLTTVQDVLNAMSNRQCIWMLLDQKTARSIWLNDPKIYLFTLYIIYRLWPAIFRKVSYQKVKQKHSSFKLWFLMYSSDSMTSITIISNHGVECAPQISTTFELMKWHRWPKNDAPNRLLVWKNTKSSKTKLCLKIQTLNHFLYGAHSTRTLKSSLWRQC